MIKITYTIVFFLLLTNLVMAQETSEIITVPQVIHFKFNDALQLDATTRIEFVEVVSDSRCPTNVSCIRAGEAIVVVNVYEKDKFIRQEKLVFYPSGVISKKILSLFSSKKFSAMNVVLVPYPNGINKIKDINYEISIFE